MGFSTKSSDFDLFLYVKEKDIKPHNYIYKYNGNVLISITIRSIYWLDDYKNRFNMRTGIFKSSLNPVIKVYNQNTYNFFLKNIGNYYLYIGGYLFYDALDKDKVELIISTNSVPKSCKSKHLYALIELYKILTNNFVKGDSLIFNIKLKLTETNEELNNEEIKLIIDSLIYIKDYFKNFDIDNEIEKLKNTEKEMEEF